MKDEMQNTNPDGVDEIVSQTKRAASQAGGYVLRTAWSPSKYLRQHAEAVFGPAHRLLLSAMSGRLRAQLNAARTPGRRESFEGAVKRLRLTEADLSAQLARFKNVHLALYVLAGALSVYALWLALDGSFIGAVSVALLTCGAAVHGYLAGFRAWQIEHRSLIRLQDALLIPGTYLVL